MSSQNDISDSSDTSSVCSMESIVIDHKLDKYNFFDKEYNGYYLIHELGRGAFSIVYLCYNINKDKFYAIKINHPNEYEEMKNEINFHKRLPSNYKNNDIIFNKIIESFVKIIDKKKFYFSIYRLFGNNLDDHIREGYYPNGFDEETCIKMIYNVVRGLDYLHNKLHVYHGDLKPDNILLKGNNKMISKIIKDYRDHKYFKLLKSNDISSTNKTNKIKFHTMIVNEIVIDKELKYECDDNIILKGRTVLSDFGNFCDINDSFEDDFGTRYYRAPEVILVNKCGYGVDIWALGCTFYEILTGEYLFDPKKKDFDTNHEHLNMIIDRCGSIPKKIIKKSPKKKMYFTKDLKLKKYSKKYESLKEFFNKKFDNENIVNFLLECLKTNQNDRSSATKLLKHSLFENLNDEIHYNT